MHIQDKDFYQPVKDLDKPLGSKWPYHNDEVLICIDLECHCRNDDKAEQEGANFGENRRVCEVGLTVLESTAIKDLAPGDRFQNAWPFFQSFSLAVKEHEHRKSDRHQEWCNVGCAQDFLFGETQLVWKAELKEVVYGIIRSFTQRDGRGQSDMSVEASSDVSAVPWSLDEQSATCERDAATLSLDEMATVSAIISTNPDAHVSDKTICSSQISQNLAANLCNQTNKDKEIVFLMFGGGNDKKWLQNLDIDLELDFPNSRFEDLQYSCFAMMLEINLNKHLSSAANLFTFLGIPTTKTHNGGNDTVFEMQAFLAPFAMTKETWLQLCRDKNLDLLPPIWEVLKIDRSAEDEHDVDKIGIGV